MNSELALHCPLTFSAPVPAGDAHPDTAPFSGLAYAGGAMENASGTFVIDLATMVHKGPLPLLWEHDRREAIGTVDAITAAGDLRITGKIFATDPRGAGVISKGRRGFPWGLSVGVTGAVEAVPIGVTRVINGRSHVGHFTLIRNARLREVSVVSVAADAATALQFNRRCRLHRMPNGAWILI